MGNLILAALFFGFLYWLIKKITKKSVANSEVSTSTQTYGSSYEIKDTYYSKKTIGSTEYWLLNPRHPLPISIYNTDEKTVAQLKSILNEPRTVKDITELIMPIVCRSNLRCKEIDDYVAKYKPVYLASIEKQKENSTEWLDLGEKDKEDLLVSFRKKAVDSLYIRPYCDLEMLFEGEPSDVTIDDALLDRYGYINMALYLKFLDKPDKVKILKSDSYLRKPFEELVALGLAKRGADIKLEDILNTFNLNDLNNFSKDTAPEPFKRKNKAIEHLLSLPNIQDKLSNKIAFREFFQLKSLPEEFSQLDLRKVATAWQYSNEIAYLIAHTYWSSNMISEKYEKEYGLKCQGSILTMSDDLTCQFCKERAEGKTFNRRPSVPLHIGCRCQLDIHFED